MCNYRFEACNGEQIVAEAAKIEGGAAHSNDIARTYWLHKRTTLVLGLLKLLRELSKQIPNV